MRIVSSAVLAVLTAGLAQVLGLLLSDDLPRRIGADAVVDILSILTSSMLAVTIFFAARCRRDLRRSRQHRHPPRHRAAGGGPDHSESAGDLSGQVHVWAARSDRSERAAL